MDIMNDEPLSPLNNEPSRPVRRSIRQISKGNTDRNFSSTPLQSSSAPLNTESPLYASRKYRSGNNTKIGIGAGVLILGAVAFFAITSMNSGAVVTVHQKSWPLAITNEEITIGGPESQSDLRYEIATLSETASETLKATGEEYVEKKAGGEITIYNDTEEPQDLVERTRFQTSDGKIFRIQKDIKVPARSASGAGSIVASVLSDSAGEEYNIPPSSFEVSSYIGTDLGKKLYAKSTSAFVGGFKGESKVVDEDDKADAVKRLKDKISKKVLTDAPLKLSKEGLIPLRKDEELEFEESPTTDTGDSVTITLKGTLNAEAISLSKLAEHLSKEKIDDYNGEQVMFDDPSRLSISQSSSEESEEGESDVVTVKVSGSTSITTSYDEKKLKEKLVGSSESDLTKIAETFPGISSLEVDLTPFWRRSLPSDASNITIKTLKK